MTVVKPLLDAENLATWRAHAMDLIPEDGIDIAEWERALLSSLADEPADLVWHAALTLIDDGELVVEPRGVVRRVA